jgi:hypothetical protein
MLTTTSILLALIPRIDFCRFLYYYTKSRLMQWAGHVVLQSEYPGNSAQAVNFDFCSGDARFESRSGY